MIRRRCEGLASAVILAGVDVGTSIGAESFAVSPAPRVAIVYCPDDTRMNTKQIESCSRKSVTPRPTIDASSGGI